MPMFPNFHCTTADNPRWHAVTKVYQPSPPGILYGSISKIVTLEQLMPAIPDLVTHHTPVLE